MNNINYGKKFEQKFKQDFNTSFPDSFILRLNDQMTGYKNNSRNICDFICFFNSQLFLIECKSHRGASIPIDNITQYKKLKDKVGIKGVRVGVVLWLIEKYKVLYIPISTITQMIKDGKKSIGLKAIEEGYNIKVLPSVERRIFLDTDYSSLMTLQEGE